MSGVFATEGSSLSSWLKGEVQDPTRHTRDNITILAGEVLTTGTVLGKITASGKYVAWDTNASDGSQLGPVGILITTAVNGDTTADQDGVMLSRGPAAIIRDGLVWGADVSGGEITAALLVFKGLGIIEREGA